MHTVFYFVEFNAYYLFSREGVNRYVCRDAFAATKGRQKDYTLHIWLQWTWHDWSSLTLHILSNDGNRHQQFPYWWIHKKVTGAKYIKLHPVEDWILAVVTLSKAGWLILASWMMTRQEMTMRVIVLMRCSMIRRLIFEWMALNSMLKESNLSTNEMNESFEMVNSWMYSGLQTTNYVCNRCRRKCEEDVQESRCISTEELNKVSNIKQEPYDFTEHDNIDFDCNAQYRYQAENQNTYPVSPNGTMNMKQMHIIQIKHEPTINSNLPSTHEVTDLSSGKRWLIIPNNILLNLSNRRQALDLKIVQITSHVIVMWWLLGINGRKYDAFTDKSDSEIPLHWRSCYYTNSSLSLQM